MANARRIRVRGASQHNLKSIDLEIPLERLTVVTGVSGSGKSSLAFDTLYREGRRRYLESLSLHARRFLGRLDRPEFDSISRLPPALAVDQRSVVRNPRSTVGTLSELYDLLRLLYARLGKPEPHARNVTLERRLFSFNSPHGACPRCRGLGVEDRLDTELMVADPALSLRGGALSLTTPSGYIMYSQVTMAVLGRVCESHGFSIDTPWNDLTPEEKDVVWHGSRRIRIPYGKHPLESRLKWSGITARPRREGFYRGIIPVMQGILDRKRNPGILRFVRSLPCRDCEGTRLRPEARGVHFQDRSITELARLRLEELLDHFKKLEFDPRDRETGMTIARAVIRKADRLCRLGLGHLRLQKPSPSLSGGEARLIRLANMVDGGLRGVLFVLDEPTAGVHPRDTRRLLDILIHLRDNGNTVVVVEHDEEVIRAADWVIDIGPGAADAGGEVLYCGPGDGFRRPRASGLERSVTRAYLTGKAAVRGARPKTDPPGRPFRLTGASAGNLRNLTVEFLSGSINVVTGVAGAGKSALVHDSLGKAAAGTAGPTVMLEECDRFRRVVEIDDTPIGRTPRSNPATYLGLYDRVRELFAAQPEARRQGFTKSRFSFNVRGGRCETCRGTGRQRIEMHFLGTAETGCETCGGTRFNRETLSVRFKGRTIADILATPIGDAADLFAGQPAIERALLVLTDLGLGYLALGRPATTLSGGEAQRIKLAAQLGRIDRGRTLYILDEPTTGLHAADIDRLLACLRRLAKRGHTIVLIEHNLDVILAADRIIDLGPEGGTRGGRLMGSGPPEHIARIDASPTGRALQARLGKPTPQPDSIRTTRQGGDPAPIRLRGVTTHNLRHVDVDFPIHRMTMVTGVSGSGKSSLVSDTVYTEGRERFLAGLSTYARTFFSDTRKAEFESVSGLTPAIALGRSAPSRNPRSTVGTLTGIYDDLRLLFSRFGHRVCPECGERLAAGVCPACGFQGGPAPTARMFSFNHESGACPECRGLGILRVCDPDGLITHPDRTLPGGAMAGHRAGRFYGDPDGQHIQTLRTVGGAMGLDFSRTWKELDEKARAVALEGTGDREWDVAWRFKRGGRTGTHRFRSVWPGMIALINREYQRKHADKRGRDMEGLMRDELCPACGGGRLKPELLSVRYAGLGIAELCRLPAARLQSFFAKADDYADPVSGGGRDRRADELTSDLLRRIRPLLNLGLEHLTLERRTDTLSDGELRRTRLAAQMGQEMSGITYLLDEPTIGLHPRDTERLLEEMRRLKERGNTMIVVEHDADVISAGDHIIELGPGSGDVGGRVTAAGPTEAFMRGGSLTAAYLRGEKRIPIPSRRCGLQPGVRIHGADRHNLRDLDLEIPAGGLIGVSGVSGSGKSTLIMEVAAASAEAGRPRGCREIAGLDRFARVIRSDSAALTTQPTSTPVSLMGIFETIRELFAATPEAVRREWGKSRFALSIGGGRCEACRGSGRRRVHLDFLSDLRLPCPECRGRRYSDATLEITWRGRSIADILEMTVRDAAGLFSDRESLARPLEVLGEVGLGYLRLGQAAATLSGGEARRLKLAVDLARSGRGRHLYLLDEPTTGLHFDDIRRLLILLRALIEKGHTVVVIEHHPDVLRSADWIIDLGPGAGEDGGGIVAAGPPEAIADCPASFTGRALRPVSHEPSALNRA